MSALTLHADRRSPIPCCSQAFPSPFPFSGYAWGANACSRSVEQQGQPSYRAADYAGFMQQPGSVLAASFGQVPSRLSSAGPLTDWPAWARDPAGPLAASFAERRLSSVLTGGRPLPSDHVSVCSFQGLGLPQYPLGVLCDEGHEHDGMVFAIQAHCYPGMTTTRTRMRMAVLAIMKLVLAVQRPDGYLYCVWRGCCR